MSGFTPGPWRTTKVQGSRTWEISARGWKDLAEVYGNLDKELHEQGEANARLIAAAPDLVHVAREALNALHEYVPAREAAGTICGYGRAVIAALTAAIAKAEGR